MVFSNYDVVEPDLLYVSHDRSAEVLTTLNVQGAPELVIEIASRGTCRRDETIKRRLYERSRVVEYWVVDPALDVVRIHRREDDAFARVAEVSRERGDSLTTPLLPGLELRLSEIFRD